MPTRVRLNCPSCGIVETYNYDWPEQQVNQQKCPFCGSLAEFMTAEVVPRKGDPQLIESKEGNEYGGEISGEKPARKRRKE